MEDEIKKMKKNENIMTVLLLVFIVLFVLVIFLVVINKKNEVVEEPQVIDENSYVIVEDIDNTEYLTLYANANLKRVYFTNLTTALVSDFNATQEEFINTVYTNIDTNIAYIDKYNTDNEITDYVISSSVDTTVLYDLKDDVLSLLYLVEDEVAYKGVTNYITNILVDVNTSSLITNDELLEKYSLTKEGVSLEIFNNIIDYHNEEYIDKDTEETLTTSDVLAKQEDYINLLVENFDNYIYLYFNEDSLYLKYNRNDIAKLLFNEDLDNTKYSTLKLEI